MGRRVQDVGRRGPGAAGVVGVGIDLCEVARIERSVERHGVRFLRRVYAAREMRLCRGRPAEHLAARFAVKEAFAKAARALRVPWRDVVVATPPGEPPVIELRGEAKDLMARIGADRAHVSLSHDGGIAAAVVILEAAGRDHGDDDHGDDDHGDDRRPEPRARRGRRG